MARDLAGGIIETANALGMDPVDLATIISYETAGTFDPTKAGPTTQWGQHRGLIQWGEPQARQYGVDWNDPVGSQLGADGAIVDYFRDAGWQPGMGMLDAYSAVNAGRVGRYNASDANNGGAPGTVRDKVQNQMAGHREKALALLGGGQGDYSAGSAPVGNALSADMAEIDPVAMIEAMRGQQRAEPPPLAQQPQVAMNALAPVENWYQPIETPAQFDFTPYNMRRLSRGTA